MATKDSQQELAEHLKLFKINGLPRALFDEAPSPVAKPEGLDRRAERIEKEVDTESLRPVPLENNPYGELSLDELRAQAEVCRKCRLCETRNKVVFGAGKIDRPVIAFVGEGPGAEEDLRGEPFVGRAGQLLTAAITKGMGLERSDVYICNVVKCRPPENRAPLPDEVEACTKYLYRQLDLIQPQVIVTLGQPAQLCLSGVKTGITKLRGTWLTWRGFKLMPTFHPAYILRNPPAKKEFWADLQEVMREVGLEVK